MAARPNFIDLRSQSHGPFGSGLPSPRLHVAGEIPPELSPLDAFAAQSRLLAKQLEQQNAGGGKRMSRLPPLTIDSLSQGRPGYFRSASAEATTPLSPTSPGSGLKSEVETPGFRPVSVHPTLSDLRPSVEPPVPTLPRRDEEEFRGRRPPGNETSFFGARRDQSPPSLENDLKPRHIDRPTSNLQMRPSYDSMRQRHISLRPHDESRVAGYDARLAPPRSPFVQRTPSPRSMSMDSSDDDLSNTSNPRPNMSPHRKYSAGSGLSTSPISPQMYVGRSPSMSSEISVGGTRLPRPAFNFSRPLSRASMNGPPTDIPSRQASGDSQPSFILADDTAHTPVSMHSEGFPDSTAESGAAPSYVYSKFSLPRGKMLQRNSLIFQEGLSQSQYSWEQPVPFSNVQPFGGAPPSPPSRPSTSSLRPDTLQSRPSFDPERPSLDPGRPSLDPGRPSLDPGRPSLDPGRPSFDPNRPSADTGRSLFERGRTLTDPPRSSSERPSMLRGNTSTEAYSPSVASSSTIKARSQHSLAPTADLSPEDNVARAIEYHEAGALNKSTYHLRLAARQNDPTGMLLYALACRHGWGMRPNQREGVAWLRKAADSASLEVADDEDLMKEGKAVDLMELKARKAQFALSIYELGVSHMNGWGIEQDKVLALRCFEIAGSWGDADALAEAGFCYAQGVGCKKDLMKSAKFYRQAEAKGISMIGNSWIYKSKYSDDAGGKKSTESRSSPEKEKEKKPRNKSRTRTIFGRKRPANPEFPPI
ncbi:hypothetical protein V8E51_000851 [Hyaloscypha variabilis]